MRKETWNYSSLREKSVFIFARPFNHPPLHNPTISINDPTLSTAIQSLLKYWSKEDSPLLYLLRINQLFCIKCRTWTSCLLHVLTTKDLTWVTLRLSCLDGYWQLFNPCSHGIKLQLLLVETSRSLITINQSPQQLNSSDFC